MKFVILAAILLSGCSAATPHPASEALNAQAFKIQNECMSAFNMRKNRLIFPNPDILCASAAASIRRAERPVNWKRYL